MPEFFNNCRQNINHIASHVFAALACALLLAACVSAPPSQEAVPGTSYFERALFAVSKGRYLAAIEQYTRYIELHEKEPQYAVPALNNRGTAYWTLGRYEEAIHDFDKAVEMDPNSSLTFVNRGNVYADMGATEQAIADYSHAIELDENNGLAYSNRGLAWSSLKRFDKALPDLDKAIELGHEGLYKSLMKRGVIRYGTKDYEGAVDDFSKVIKLYPGYMEAYYFRGLSYRQMNEPEKAQEDLQTAMDLQKALESAQ